ncbi:MAG: hypothetical protein ACKVWR_17940 [Acidimicrobiales bacterium]
MLALAGGTNVAFLVVGLVVAAIAGMLAAVAWRRAAPVGGSVQTVHWWKLVAAGPVIIGGVIVAAGLGVEAWFVGMFFVFLALILTGVGLLLGLAPSHRPSAAGAADMTPRASVLHETNRID